MLIQQSDLEQAFAIPSQLFDSCCEQIKTDLEKSLASRSALLIYPKLTIVVNINLNCIAKDGQRWRTGNFLDQFN